MDIEATVAQIASLSVEERLAVVEAIWETIFVEAAFDVTPAERELIERRLAAHAANPDAVVPWEEVKAAALARIHT